MASPLRAVFAGGGPAKRVVAKWYSGLEKAIEAADPTLKSLPFDKWVQYLTGRPGVKQEELDIVMPQVKEMIGPRTGPILKTDILDLVKHVNSLSPLQEWQSGHSIKAEDLPYTSEASPLQMFSQVHRSTPEAATPFEVGQGRAGDTRYGYQHVYSAPELFGDNAQTYTAPPDNFLGNIVSKYNELNATKYPSPSKFRLPGGTDYKETVIGSPLAESMAIGDGHFGKVPKVGDKQISWAMHHKRDDGPLTPEQMAIPDEIEQVIEQKARKGQVGSLNDISSLRNHADQTDFNTDVRGGQTLQQIEEAGQRGPRPEPDQHDPFGEIDTLTGEFANWISGIAEQGDTTELLHIAMNINWPQEHQDYLTNFIQRWDAAQEIADGGIPAVPGWERNPDYNPYGPGGPDNPMIRDPDDDGRLATAYENYSEAVAAGGVPNHTYFTHAGTGISNPYEDDAGQALTNPGAYWAARGHDRTMVHRAMNDFLVRYQDPPEAGEQAALDAGARQWQPDDPNGLTNQEMTDRWGLPEERYNTIVNGDDELNLYEPYFIVGNDTPVFNPMKTENGADLEGRNAAIDYWVINKGIDIDTVDSAMAHWEEGARRFQQEWGEIPPNGHAVDPLEQEMAQQGLIPQDLQDRWTAARRQWQEGAADEPDHNLAFGNYETLDRFMDHLDELEPNQVQEILDEELPARLANDIDALHQLRRARAAPAQAPVQGPAVPEVAPNLVRATAQARLHDAEEAINDFWQAHHEEGGLPDTFEQFLADLENHRDDPDVDELAAEYFTAEDNLMAIRAPEPDVQNLVPPAAPPRHLDQAREAMIRLARQEYGNTQEINDSILDIANSDIDLAETGWPQALQDAADHYRTERRLQNINFDDVPPGPHPEQMDQRTDEQLIRQAVEQEFGVDFGEWDGHWRATRNDPDYRFDLENELVNFSPEAQAAARRRFGLAQPEPNATEGQWEVFDPQTGDPIAFYATEAEARRHANVNGRWDYARAGEGWTTEQKTKKVPNPDKPKGTKVTMIDELQSHRHQEGRQEGYKGEDIPIRAERDRVRDETFELSPTWEKDYSVLAQNITPERWAHLYGTGDTDTSINQQRNAFTRSVRTLIEDQQDPQQAFTDLFGADPPEGAFEALTEKMRKFAEAKERYNVLDKQLSGKSFQTPQAPYKKDWPLLTLRRMLWQAAEDGSDYLAWNTSEEVQKHGTGKKIADALYDKELPTFAKGELKRLGMSKDDLTQIEVGPKKGSGLTKSEMVDMQDIATDDLGPEVMELAETLVNPRSPLRNKIKNVLTHGQAQEFEALSDRYREYMKALDDVNADDDDDELFDNLALGAERLVGWLNRIGVHKHFLPKPNAWAIKLTPEIRAKILKDGLPKFAAVGLPAAEVAEFFKEEDNDAGRP